MDIRELNCFLAVAFEGNLTRAAESLFLSQSALSGRIRQLEEELDCTLFVRKARGMDLTDEGETLLPYARSAVQAMEEFKARAAGLKREATPSLVVGLNTDPAFLRMAELAGLMRKAVPNARLSFIVSQSRYTAKMLRSGEMHVGFRFGMWGEEGIYDEMLSSVTLNIAIPNNLVHKVEFGNWQSLGNLPWIYSFSGCPFHVVLRERLSTYGTEPNLAEQADDENIMREFAAEGLGAAILREDEARQLKESGKAKLWPEPLHVPLCLSYPTGSGYATPLREFREVVRNVLRTDKTDGLHLPADESAAVPVITGRSQ
ncbi:LysR family transcriptional regulator [Maridesulfovibrio sp.]|uniref:LysR family transcriptional regulator n=1 Tax=Maridesulfovibrio sp. TaxID=2795000 RepID=UPI002A1869BA|nr:LysR family transcriptional regulator [Maridesulfovibrio sp.]